MDFDNNEVMEESPAFEETVAYEETEPMQSPVSAIAPSFKPENGIIAEITPANFDMFSKILNFLEKSDSIVIKDSKISQSVSGAIIFADIHKAFDGKDVNLEILNPKKTIKLFKQFRNNSNIYIHKDDENKRFIMTNGEIRLFLPQQIEALTEAAKFPDDFDKATWLYSMKLDKATSKVIQGLASDSNYIEYIIQDNALKALHIPDTATYTFTDYLSDPKAKTLNETNADVLLRSDVFLPIAAEEYDLRIGQLPNKTYFSYVECNIGFDSIKIGIYEDLKDATGGDIFG